MGEVSKILIEHQILKNYCVELLTRRGIDRADAETTVDIMVTSDLRGVDTHGILRMATYLKRLDLGLLAKDNNITVVAEKDNFVVIDGGNYLGPEAAKMAMSRAIEKAKDNTVGLAFVRNNHHYGACAYYSMMALESDMIGFTSSNGAPVMAPTGGKKRVIGNNPFFFAAPAGKYKPFVN